MVSAGSAQARVAPCTVLEVRTWPSKTHVQCLEQLTDDTGARKIRWFVGPAGTPQYDDLRLYGTKALEGGLLMVDYDPGLTSAQETAHNAVNCVIDNCRLAKSVWLRDRGPYELHFEAGGHRRYALVYPGTARHDKSPVIFFFTGHGGTASAAAGITRFHVLWPEATVVYAQGLNQGSNGILASPRFSADAPGSNRGPGWQIRFPYKAEPPIGYTADLDYVDTLYDIIRTREKIDNTRVFAVGYSSGGVFTLSLVRLRPNMFTRFAPMASYGRMNAQIRPNRDPVLNRSAVYATLTPFQIASHKARPVLYAYGKLDFGFDPDGGDPLVSWDPADPVNSKSGRTLRDLGLLARCNFNTIIEFGRIPATPRTYLTDDPDGAPLLWWPFEDDHNYTVGMSETVVRFFKSTDPEFRDVFPDGSVRTCGR